MKSYKNEKLCGEKERFFCLMVGRCGEGGRRVSLCLSLYDTCL